MKYRPGELAVVRKAKDLTEYIFLITRTSPKRFRFSLVSRLQNLSLDIVAELQDANTVYIRDMDPAAVRERLDHQKRALSLAGRLEYVAELSAREGAISMKQYGNISVLTKDIRNMTGAWINSDSNRIRKSDNRNKR